MKNSCLEAFLYLFIEGWVKLQSMVKKLMVKIQRIVICIMFLLAVL